MNVPEDLKYTRDHEWLKVDGEVGITGITDYAQSELGDIVYVEVDSVGENKGRAETYGTIEAVKTVADLNMPVSGHIDEFNDRLTSSPQDINKDPYGKGWIIRFRITDPRQIDELLTPEEYRKLIGG